MGALARPYKSASDVVAVVASAEKEIAPIRFDDEDDVDNDEQRRRTGELRAGDSLQLGGGPTTTTAAAAAAATTTTPPNNSFSFGFGLNDLLLVARDQRWQRRRLSGANGDDDSANGADDSLADTASRVTGSARAQQRRQKAKQQKRKSDGSSSASTSSSSASSSSVSSSSSSSLSLSPALAADDETQVRLLAASQSHSQLHHRNNLSYFSRIELLKNRRQYKSLATTNDELACNEDCDDYAQNCLDSNYSDSDYSEQESCPIGRSDICVHVNDDCKQDFGRQTQRSSPNLVGGGRPSVALGHPNGGSDGHEQGEQRAQARQQTSGQRRTRRLVSWTALKRQVRLRNASDNGNRLVRRRSRRRMHPSSSGPVGHRAVGGGGGCDGCDAFGSTELNGAATKPAAGVGLGEPVRELKASGGNGFGDGFGGETVSSDALRNRRRREPTRTGALEREKNCIVCLAACEERHNWLARQERPSNDAAHCCSFRGGAIKLDGDGDGDDIEAAAGAAAAAAARLGTCCAPDSAVERADLPKSGSGKCAAVRSETTAATGDFRCRVSSATGNANGNANDNDNDNDNGERTARTSADRVDTCCKDARKSSRKHDEAEAANSELSWTQPVGERSKFNVVVSGGGSEQTIALSERVPMRPIGRVVCCNDDDDDERQRVDGNESNLGGDANSAPPPTLAPIAMAAQRVGPPISCTEGALYLSQRVVERDGGTDTCARDTCPSSSSWRLCSRLVATASGSYDLPVDLGGRETDKGANRAKTSATKTATSSPHYWRPIAPPEVTSSSEAAAAAAAAVAVPTPSKQQVEPRPKSQQQQRQRQQWRLARPGRSPMSLARQTSARLAKHRLEIQNQRQEQLAALARRERLSLKGSSTPAAATRATTTTTATAATTTTAIAATTGERSLSRQCSWSTQRAQDEIIDVIDSASESNDSQRLSRPCSAAAAAAAACAGRATGRSQRRPARHHAARNRPTSGAGGQWQRLSYERRGQATGAREVSGAFVVGSALSRLARAASFGYFCTANRVGEASRHSRRQPEELGAATGALREVCVDLRNQIRVTTVPAATTTSATTTTTTTTTTSRATTTTSGNVCDNSNEMYRSVVDCDRPVASHRKKTSLMTTKSKSSSGKSTSNEHNNSDSSSNNKFNNDNDDDEKSSSSGRSESSWSLEGRPFCKICHTGNSKLGDRLISPCKCSGTMRYVHCGCLLKWLELSNRSMEKPMSCELCSHEYTWHKRFNFKHMQLPTCSLKDTFLHLLFVLSICSMLYCALAPLMSSTSATGNARKQQEISPTRFAPTAALQQQQQQSATTSQSRADAPAPTGELSADENAEDSIERFVEELIGKKRRTQQQRQKQQVKQTNANSLAPQPPPPTGAISSGDTQSDHSASNSDTQFKNSAQQKQHQQQQQHSAALFTNGYTNHLNSNGRLASDEKLILISAAAFFASFFLAIYVQTKTRDTLYGLCVRFVHMNRTYYIMEYDHEQDDNNNATTATAAAAAAAATAHQLPSSSSSSSTTTERTRHQTNTRFTCATVTPSCDINGYYSMTTGNGLGSVAVFERNHSLLNQPTTTTTTTTATTNNGNSRANDNNRNGNCCNGTNGNNTLMTNNSVSSDPANATTRLNHFVATGSNPTTATTTSANKYFLH